MSQFVEKVYKSRKTLLSVLHDRGYDTEGQEKFGPEEIRAALAANPAGRALEFTVKAREGMKTPTPNVRVYIFMMRIKQKLPGFLGSLEPPINASEEQMTTKNPDKLGSPVDPALTSIVCLINEPVATVFHQASINMWATKRLRLTFFHLDSFQMNPLKHFAVPPHEIVPVEEHEAMMKSMYITAKTQFPLIRYHEDPITRVIGCIPGDIIKITRPSPSAGEYIVYRVCVP